MKSFWERRHVGLLVIAVASVVFASTLVFGRVDFDDMWLWADDSPLRSLSATTLREMFFELDARARHDYGTEYLPIRDLVVAADMAVWDDGERGPHATQLALYALTLLATGTMLVRFGFRGDVAWIATLLWSVHPIHVESVAWLSERKGVLAGLFVMVTACCWLRYRRGGHRLWLCLAALGAVAGVWSKAPAMFAPLVLAAWDCLLLTPSHRRVASFGVIGGVTALAAIPVIAVARDGNIVTSALGAGERLVAAIGSLGHYVESTLLVRSPAIAYPIQTDGPAIHHIILGLATIVGSLALVVIGRHRDGYRARIAVLAWAWIWFLPISHLLAPVHILVADRFAYLWLLAPCIALAWLLGRVPSNVRLGATSAVVCVLAVASVRAQEAWTSSIELFRNATISNPRDPKACENYATALAAEARRPEAIRELDRGLALLPNHPYLLMKKARLLWAMKQSARAREAAAIAALSGHASAMWTYAQLLQAAGQREPALLWAERASVRAPEFTTYTTTYIDLLLALDRRRDAERVARILVVREPTKANIAVLEKVLRQATSPASQTGPSSP